MIPKEFEEDAFEEEKSRVEWSLEELREEFIPNNSPGKRQEIELPGKGPDDGDELG